MNENGPSENELGENWLSENGPSENGSSENRLSENGSSENGMIGNWLSEIGRIYWLQNVKLKKIQDGIVSFGCSLGEIFTSMGRT